MGNLKGVRVAILVDNGSERAEMTDTRKLLMKQAPRRS